MAIQPTSAAQKLASTDDEISSHELISLLMAGGLERIEQAKDRLVKGNSDEAELLVAKVIGIIDGLRASLDFQQGGEIAVNLSSLYDYMLSRLPKGPVGPSAEIAMEEVHGLLADIKDGWDNIDSN